MCFLRVAFARFEGTFPQKALLTQSLKIGDPLFPVVPPITKRRTPHVDEPPNGLGLGEPPKWMFAVGFLSASLSQTKGKGTPFCLASKSTHPNGFVKSGTPFPPQNKRKLCRHTQMGFSSWVPTSPPIKSTHKKRGSSVFLWLPL